MLRSLGYLGGDDPQPSVADQSFDATSSGPDPKDMLHVYQRIMFVITLFEEGRGPEAADILKRILAGDDPTNRRARQILAHIEAKDR